MKVRVKIIKATEVERTYEVDGVNDLETAKKCALRCATRQFQPNAYMMREVPQPPTYRFDSMEIVES